jgi:hypothetical protein
MGEYAGLFRIVSRINLAGDTAYVIQSIVEGWPWQDKAQYDTLEEAISAVDSDFNHYQRTTYLLDVVVVE